MDTAILEKEFDAAQIKRRKGRNGMMLDYIQIPNVIRRLNAAFEYYWSFEIVSFEIMDTEVVVQGKLTAEGMTKSQFGSSLITKSRQNGEKIAIGDDMKSAGSDALKKCATLFGIALHLYSESEAATESETNKEEMSQNQGNGTITQEQLAEIKQLRTSLEWKPDQVLDIVERMFGNRDIMAINPVMATNLIAHLQSQGNGAADSQKEEMPF